MIVIDGTEGIGAGDTELIARIRKKKIPFLLVLNKADLVSEQERKAVIAAVRESGGDIAPRPEGDETDGAQTDVPVLWISAKTGEGIERSRKSWAARRFWKRKKSLCFAI